MKGGQGLAPLSKQTSHPHGESSLSKSGATFQSWQKGRRCVRIPRNKSWAAPLLFCVVLQTNSQSPWKSLPSLLHFFVPYPMSPCHPMECSENMGLIINLCTSSCHPRPAGWLERTQAKTLLLPGNLSDYVTEQCTGYTHTNTHSSTWTMARKHVFKHDKSTVIDWQRAVTYWPTKGNYVHFKICPLSLCFSFSHYHNHTVH